MINRTGVVAHLIVGKRDEPFLAALLTSLTGAADVLIVNDNAPDPSPHAEAFARSSFARAGTLVLDRTAWVDFSHARNRCLQIHHEMNAGPWIAFVDADEVHGAPFGRLAAHAARIPSGVDFVDGYTWHFFQSFDWYRSIERRMSLFRFTPEVNWTGRVHEKLVGLRGTRIALPYVYAHYGNVLPARRHAEKGRQYSALGAPGGVMAEDQLDAIDPETYFRGLWAPQLRFTGAHPPAALAALAALRLTFADHFAQTDRLVRAQQPLPRRIENAFAKLNYEQRWRFRHLNPLAHQLVS